MNLTKLKPCPFCGAKVGYFEISKLWGICCRECGAVVSFVDNETKVKAGKAWNRRVKNG